MTRSEQGHVQAVVRALELLRLMARSDDGHRVSDLARQAGLAVSTAHRLLTTLESMNFAHFDAEDSLWHVGREAFSVGSAYVQRHNFIAPALPFLRRLRDETRETANLGVLDADQLVTVSQVESREIVRAISPPGGRVPAFCSAMGKAILATWQDEEIARFAARNGFHPLTPRSHRNLDTAMGDITRIRQCGYAIDGEEHAAGLSCVGAVVWSRTGDAICALSVSALSARMPPERIAQVGPVVKGIADQLTAALGGRPMPFHNAEN
ncbi:IclR family transcriptional regulator [Pseudoprimorskyibacter insulae]|uniref:HTH-type transcriptional repressor AllR n=1 Tax=Pseudoprimorskyibacter insulae TaxID=1695997 RepID=A0A2R8AZB2_9RHOB|nr:IclR family transcriptional regulator [Pseudoprimorskyibacter insulae]SPF81189.1 HTH-type transcriptional repressor AllR [Pseudoprimorskyibacter insulae]